MHAYAVFVGHPEVAMIDHHTACAIAIATRHNSTMTTGAADKTAGRVLLPSNIVPIRYCDDCLYSWQGSRAVIF